MATPKLVVIRNAVISAAMLLALAACVSAPQIRTQATPGLDLGRFTTYNFVEHPGTDRGNYRSITTRYLEQAVDREMTARGFTKSDHPELLIDFHTVTRDRLRGEMGPSWGWGWGGGWGWGYGWGPGWAWGGWGPGWWGGPGPWGLGGWNDIQAYTEGTLTIDVIDAMDKDAIWSGSAISRVYQSALEHPQASIDETVAHIFEKFPRQPVQAAGAAGAAGATGAAGAAGAAASPPAH